MRFGYAVMLLAFAAIISFHSLNWALGIAGLSLLAAFCRFALQVQEKKEEKQSADDAARVLNEQAEELGKTLSKLFGNTMKKNSSTRNKKYNTDPDSDLH
ncbi:MAG: hypothetical protein CMF51_04405 [Legionellales bacterium]|nr:hypothetical protein [Legionellales bacterium]